MIDRMRQLESASLEETLVERGLDRKFARLLDQMPQKLVTVEPRRVFRDVNIDRDEVMFVRSGLISKFKTDSAGRRQIVALRFPGEGILPREGMTDYGVQAIVRSQVMIGRAEDFDKIVDDNPDIARFFVRLMQRHQAIGYEWLVNCGRRDSIARVAHLLCETVERAGLDAETEPLSNPFTQQQIADITGQTSVNVNRVFADLERQGLISRRGREIRFNDFAELRRVASFQPGYLQ